MKAYKIWKYPKLDLILLGKKCYEANPEFRCQISFLSLFMAAPAFIFVLNPLCLHLESHFSYLPVIRLEKSNGVPLPAKFSFSKCSLTRLYIVKMSVPLSLMDCSLSNRLFLLLCCCWSIDCDIFSRVFCWL